MEFTKSKSFIVMDNNLVSFRRDISLFYAEKFKNGSINQAISELRDRMSPIGQKDFALIFLFIGMIISLVISFFLLKFINKSEDNHTIVSMFPSFSFSFMIIFCFFGLGINIQIFRKYRINYIFIFEIDPKTRISQEKIYRVIICLIRLHCFY